MNAVTDPGVSGLSGGNAGGQGLDDAIAAAFSSGGLDPDTPQGTQPGDDIADELTNPAVANLREGAGENRDGEDAAAAAGDTVKAVDGKSPQDKATALEAPKHWPAADKATFAKLPPEGKESLLKLAKNLEGGFTRKSQELSDHTRFSQQVRSQFSDADRAQMQQVGVDEVGAIQYLMQLQRFASQRPAEYVMWAMHTLGVSPDDLPSSQAAQGQKPQAPDQPAAQTGDPKLDELLADPAVKQLRAELAEAKQTIGQIAGKLTARDRWELEQNQRHQYAQRQSLLSVVQQFRGQQDETGQLQYPHFDDVMPQMGAIMQTDPKLRSMPDGVEKMARAYAKVVQGDPELSKPIFEAELAKRLQAERKQAEATRAKQVARVKPAGGVPAQRAKSNSIDEAIAASFLKHGY